MNEMNLTELRKLIASDIKMELISAFVDARKSYDITSDEFYKAVKLIAHGKKGD